MKISVILPALNEEGNIGRAIQSVIDAGADEIIVVDGGSEDETREIARARDCVVLRCQAGRGLQQHYGADHATGDVLLFLHADSFIGRGAVDQIRCAMKRESCRFGAFRQRIDCHEFKFRLLELGNMIRIRLLSLPYGDQGIFIRRDFYDEITGFPPWRLMEDVALSRKAARKSRPVLLKGPIVVNPRRWERGVLRQTFSNWSLMLGYILGKSNQELAERYEKKRSNG